MAATRRLAQGTMFILLALAVSSCDGAEEGEPCDTEGADDHQETCDGDDLLYCVCDDYEGNDCPSGQGTWTKQGILCTCDEWMDGKCPVE